MKPSFMARSSSRSGMHFEAPLSKQQLLLYFEAGTPPPLLSSLPLLLPTCFRIIFYVTHGTTYESEEGGGDSPITKYQGVRTRNYLRLPHSIFFFNNILETFSPHIPISLHASIHYPGILPPLPFSSGGGGGKGGAGNSRENGRERTSPTFPSRQSTGKIAIEEKNTVASQNHKKPLKAPCIGEGKCVRILAVTSASSAHFQLCKEEGEGRHVRRPFACP